ncbi:hypothetical protein [Corynebacterium sp.]|uniref:hypothetical protein n=1 Tax=Corynebacterium sp. TaxID=1720 RepID=UPI0026472D8F|nr:hypothetical protein [Corynebacterium sp.]MDN6377043.1 hypothetical protein [Corynebacterium sp.]
MLALALLMSLLGFIALLVALYVGSIFWAWVCIVVALIGAGLFVVGRVVHRRR